MANHIFVLSYCGADQFFSETKFKQFSNSKFYFIDNGKQSYKNSLDCWEYTTQRNIGCAGGWNLICKIAFEYMQLDKVIITQDDALYSEDSIEEALYQTDDDTITGVLSPYFEFSCFGITKECYSRVGAFDENFLWVYCEDADYKHRAMRLGVMINSLFVDPRGANQSLSIKTDPSIDKTAHNKAYLTLKWGESVHPMRAARNDYQAPFKYSHPFNNSQLPLDFIPITDSLKKAFPDVSTSMPSEIEFNRFIKEEINGIT